MKRRETALAHAAIWTSAIVVGIAAVLYARLIAVVQGYYFTQFEDHRLIVTLLGPVFFVAATFLVKRFAPEAKGSGIPQVLEAIELGKPAHLREHAPVSDREPAREVADPWKSPLISIRTAGIKVASSILGFLGGASIGREGPTVQISATVFGAVGRLVRRRLPGVDLPSYLTAGAAAGVAAAFNTPLAGITFALEEVAEGIFGPFRQTMMLAVIIGGITARMLIGDYLYFGHPSVEAPALRLIYETLVIAVAAGLLGGAFARMLSDPKLVRLPKTWLQRSLICGLICAIIGYFTHGQTAGSGYEVTRDVLMSTSDSDTHLLFPVWKLATTTLSYLSGMAGGIFAPSLSIGAGVGLTLSKLLAFTDFKVCALVGMVAFFSSAVQAPLTAVMIVTEMTDEHLLILPFMIAAFTAHGLGKWMMPVPLYRLLAQRNQDA